MFLCHKDNPCPFVFTFLLSPRQSWHKCCTGSYFATQCGQRGTEQHWHSMPFFQERDFLNYIYKFSKSFLGSFWDSKITAYFQSALTLWASEHSNISDPADGHCKARNFKHVYTEKIPLFVAARDKGEQNQDSLLLCQLAFACVILLKK